MNQLYYQNMLLRKNRKMEYKKLLDKALPYYEKGRPGDVEHVKWLYKVVPKFAKDLDLDILMAVVILHDVGYSKVPKNSNPYNLDIRKLHCDEGAKIANKILKELKYEENKINEITRLILKHDNWAFGDNFSDEPYLRFFNNFDFMWMASEKGFDIVRKFKNMNKKEFYEQIKKFQEKNKEIGMKWYTKEIEDYYEKLMNERKKELS